MRCNNARDTAFLRRLALAWGWALVGSSHGVVCCKPLAWVSGLLDYWMISWARMSLSGLLCWKEESGEKAKGVLEWAWKNVAMEWLWYSELQCLFWWKVPWNRQCLLMGSRWLEVENMGHNRRKWKTWTWKTLLFRLSLSLQHGCDWRRIHWACQ